MIPKIDANSPEGRLVGRQVNVKKEEVTLGSGMRYTSITLDDANFEAEVNAINSNNRIFTPSQFGTADFQTDRLNVYVDKDGVVTEVRYG